MSGPHAAVSNPSRVSRSSKSSNPDPVTLDLLDTPRHIATGRRQFRLWEGHLASPWGCCGFSCEIWALRELLGLSYHGRKCTDPLVEFPEIRALTRRACTPPVVIGSTCRCLEWLQEVQVSRVKAWKHRNRLYTHRNRASELHGHSFLLWEVSAMPVVEDKGSGTK